jgi:hypothetical protein
MRAYIYKKLLILTGKYYIGKHNGNNKWYKGSGTDWKNNYKLYVKNNKKDIITEILEYIDDISLLNEREKYWLEYFDAANNPLYYNKTNKNYGPNILPQSVKDKIGNSNRKPKPKDFLKNMKIPILQYDLKGKFIKEWKSIREASQELNLHNINGVCRGKYLTCGGFIFRYKSTPLSSNYVLPLNGNKDKKREEWICNKMKKPKPSKQKPILQYDLDNNFIKEWNSIKEASIVLNINSGRISSCCSGNILKIKKFIFKYKNYEKN